jgi:hypothetical protein
VLLWALILGIVGHGVSGLSFLRDEDQYESEFRTDPTDEEPVRRHGWTLAACLLLSLIGSGSAFLWRYYSDAIIAPVAAKLDVISQSTVTLQHLRQSQRSIADDVRRNREMLEAQQADLRRLSVEISQFAAKLDSLQKSARDAQASAPAPSQKPALRKPASKPVVHEHAPPRPLSLSPEEKK